MKPARWILPSLALITPAGAGANGFLDRRVVTVAVRHAIAHAGLGPESAVDLSRRARSAGWVPQLSVRVLQGTGVSATQIEQGYVDRASTDDRFLVDARVSFSLDRIVFDAAEVAIARAELERSERRRAVENEVIERLSVLEQCRLEGPVPSPGTLHPPPDAQARAAADTSPETGPEAMARWLECARARARLEVLTGRAIRELIRGR